MERFFWGNDVWFWCRVWVGINKVNNGRMCIVCREREYIKVVLDKDIKKFKKLKVDIGGWGGKSDRAEGVVFIFWVNFILECIMFFVACCCFLFCIDIYRYRIFIFFYIFGFFIGISGNVWIFFKRGFIDMLYGKILGICSN